MVLLPRFHQRGALPLHGHCIHNDLPPRTHNFTMKGMFAAVLWIALWSLIIMGFIGHETRRRREIAEFNKGRHFWVAAYGEGRRVVFSQCSKCGSSAGENGLLTYDDKCPETRSRPGE